MDFDWKIRSGHKQETREGYNLLDFNVTQNSKVTVNDDGTVTINGQGGFGVIFTKIMLQANKTYKAKIELVSGTIKDSSGNNMPDNSIMINLKWLNPKYYVTLINENDTTIESCWLNGAAIFNNARVKIWAYEGTEDKPYEQYGASPSPDYPSEIETVKDSVEVDVSNENLFNEQYIQGYFVNDSGKTNTSAEGARAANYIPVSDNKTIYVLFKCLKSCILARFWLMEFDENYNAIKRTTTGIYDTSFNIGNTIKQLNLSQKCKYIKPSFYSLRDGGAALTYDKFNEYFNISISRNQTEEYIEHQSQTAIMPIQQEMLDEDYIVDVEHHEWGKLTLTGNENIKLNTVFANVFNIEIPKINIMNQQVCLCNIAKGVVYNTALFTTQDNIIMTASPNKIVYRSTKFSSLSEFKTYLQNQYEKGTPVIVYYKLAEPINLELTEEQKAVREQKLYTYKNITNISLSDELASIDVEYKKDQDTINKNYENRLAALETASTSEEAE